MFTDDLDLHIIELSKLRAQPTADSTPLDLWAWLLMHAENLDTESLPPALTAEPRIVDAIGAMKMISQSEQERHEYESRLMYQRDEISKRKHFDAVAEQRGIAIGEERGISVGRLIGKIELLESLLEVEPTPPERLESLGLDGLALLEQRLEQNLRSRRSPPDSAG